MLKINKTINLYEEGVITNFNYGNWNNYKKSAYFVFHILEITLTEKAPSIVFYYFKNFCSFFFLNWKCSSNLFRW